MAKDRVTLSDVLRKMGIEDGEDFLREGVQALVRALMEVEVSSLTGAGYGERSEGRQNRRNGYRPRAWDTRVGTLEVQIPKLRQGSYFPSFLEPRRRAEKALLAVVQEAYVQGVSTRKVEDLVQALGMTGISASEVSRVCQELDDAVEAFRNRPIDAEYPYVWLDATYLKGRVDHRVVSQALVVAVGVNRQGEREVLGFDVGLSEDAAFWLEFLRSLKARGLGGVRLVISDAHEGLRQAIQTVFVGSSWQRCRVHFMRNLLSHVPKAAGSMVAATARTIFMQATPEQAKTQLHQVVETLRGRWPKAADVLESAQEDILAYLAFPQSHWRQIYSTNPLERLNKEIKRRSDVVGIFPTRQSILRLVGAVLMEQNDDWITSRRYFSQESMALIAGENLTHPAPGLEAAD